MEIDMEITIDDDDGISVQKVNENQRASALPKIGGGPSVASESLMTFQDVKSKLVLR